MWGRPRYQRAIITFSLVSKFYLVTSKGRQSRCMAVANEAPCSRLGHGVWSTPRTCSFSSCHSVPWRTVFIQWVQLRTDQKPFQQFLRTGFITAVSFFLCWKRPKPKTGISRSLDGKGWETKWLIDNTRSVKCVFECQVQGPSYWWRWPTLLSGRATRGPNNLAKTRRCRMI